MANCPGCGRWYGAGHSCPSRSAAPQGPRARGRLSRVLDRFLGSPGPDIATTPAAPDGVREIHDHFAAAFVVPEPDPRMRFGAGAVEHAEVDTARLAVVDALHTPQTYTWVNEGIDQEVTMNFNSLDAHEKVRDLAAAVVAAADKPGWQEHRDVYSPETVAAARRVLSAGGTGAFPTQRYEGEATDLYPSEVVRTPTRVAYTRTVHPDITRLISGAERDQKAHAGLQRSIQERAVEMAQRPASARFADPFAGI